LVKDRSSGTGCGAGAAAVADETARTALAHAPEMHSHR
jgi:hypothetical protein